MQKRLLKILTLLLGFFLLITACPPAPGPLEGPPQRIQGQLDFSEIGVVNAKVVLVDGEGKTVAETVTFEGGFYEFDNVNPGTYSVIPIKAHWDFTPPEQKVTIGEDPFVTADFNGAAAAGFTADPWGYIWDAEPRAVAAWQIAYDDCIADGGRLPTITELYRNNHTSGKHSLGAAIETDWKWTLIDSHSGYKSVCLLSNGDVSYDALTTERAYRCVWPVKERDTFSGSYVYTEPGTAPFPVKINGKRYVIDTLDRPAVHFNQALNEAAFYHGALPSQGIMVALIREGLAGGASADWVWTGDVSSGNSSENLLVNLIRWKDGDINFDNTYPDFANWGYIHASTGNRNYFRIIGAASYPEEQEPDIDSHKWTDRLTRLKMDLYDSPKTTLVDAVSQSLNRGGHLPTAQEYAVLVRSGLPHGVNDYLYTSDYMAGDWINLFKWNGIQKNLNVYYSGNVSWSSSATSRYFRTVYYPVDTDYPGPDESAGNGGLFMIEKKQGNGKVLRIWCDREDRSPKIYAEAVSECYAAGGQLTTHLDLVELIRSGLPCGNGTDFLWTSDQALYNQVEGVKWTGTEPDFQDTYSTNAADLTVDNSTTRPFRCVWTNEMRTP